MDKKLQNKIKTYSALTASAVLISNTAHADIIHTEVGYTGGFETYDVDIDGDQIIDFSVEGFATNFSTGSGGNVAISAVAVNGYISSNQVNAYPYGSSGGSSSGSSSSFNLAYSLNSGNLVNSTYLPFENNGALAGQFVFSATFGGFPFNTSGSFGNFGDGSEKFIGIKFDISGSTHYGWMRFRDVAQDGSSWTLVDFAYNDTEEGELYTGVTVSLDDISEIEFDLISSEESINIVGGSEILNSTISIVNMEGKTVLNTQLNDTNSTVNHNLSKGIYIVNIISTKGKAISRKIKI